MKILLDTNAYSALRRNHATVAELVREAEEVLLSTVVAGELLFGFRNGSRYEANVQVLAEFLEDPNVRLLPVTWETADLFGRISQVEREGVVAGRDVAASAVGTVRLQPDRRRVSGAMDD